MYLMLITKGGYNFNHIPNDELLQIRAKMVKAIFEGPDPLIDWIKSVNGRALCACHTIEAVQWGKTFVKQLNPEYVWSLAPEGGSEFVHSGGRHSSANLIPTSGNDNRENEADKQSSRQLSYFIYEENIWGPSSYSLLSGRRVIRSLKTDGLLSPHWNRSSPPP